jgi:hypothetical protein
MSGTKKVEETVSERHSVYGPYWVGTKLRADIMHLIKEVYLENHGEYMEEMDSVMIFDIVNKLSRLATTPRHIDTWHDIQGYASRVEEFLITGTNK